MIILKTLATIIVSLLAFIGLVTVVALIKLIIALYNEQFNSQYYDTDNQ